MVMIRVNVYEVKAKLSEYLNRAIRGERIVICRHNRPVAELRPVTETRTEPRPIGPVSGRPTFDVPPAFFEPLSSDELDLWEGIVATDSGSAEASGRDRAVSHVSERATPVDSPPRGRAPLGSATRATSHPRKGRARS